MCRTTQILYEENLLDFILATMLGILQRVSYYRRTLSLLKWKHELSYYLCLTVDRICRAVTRLCPHRDTGSWNSHRFDPVD